MKTKDINWYNEQIESIRKRKRSLKMLQDPLLVKRIKKDLEREKRSVKRAEKQTVDKFIKGEIEKHLKSQKGHR